MQSTCSTWSNCCESFQILLHLAYDSPSEVCLLLCPYRHKSTLTVILLISSPEPKAQAPIITATEDKFCDTFLIFEKMRYDISIYQSPLIFSALFQHNLINVSYLTACYLYQVMMTLHFLYVVANDAESTQKSKITSLSLV